MRKIVYNEGVLVEFFDNEKIKEDPKEEFGIILGHKNFTKSEDKVVIIGGGYGITAYWASKIVGKNGNVIIYEGGEESFNRVKRTLKINSDFNNYQVYQSIVGENINVYGGSTNNSNFISAKDIPKCDVLELDCEGSELNILKTMTIRPRIIIVEIHPKAYKPVNIILKVLNQIGYKIVQKSGHNGELLNKKELEQLLKIENKFNKKKHKKKDRFLKTTKGELARGPVVVVGEKK